MKWKIIAPAAAVGLAVTAGLMAAGAGASSAPGVVDRQHPPPIPAIVNSDGSLNESVVAKIPVMQPDGSLRLPTPAEVHGHAKATLTPAQVNAMTPAQRAAAHVQESP